MESSGFWNLMVCSLFKFNLRLEGIHWLHRQGRRMSRMLHGVIFEDIEIFSTGKHYTILQFQLYIHCIDKYPLYYIFTVIFLRLNSPGSVTRATRTYKNHRLSDIRIFRCVNSNCFQKEAETSKHIFTIATNCCNHKSKSFSCFASGRARQEGHMSSYINSLYNVDN
jgi:hypothetical protein